mmetsp:Transcript_101986/g.179593  ORF Transcript_101986/g.179593 Transcript_101986/m.179593 type:complete len:682 (+) Transcript_101986:91-2136(+)
MREWTFFGCKAAEDGPAKLYDFYKGNIHEHRTAARMSRLAPLLFIAGLLVLVLWDHLVLLIAAAVLNVFHWLWITITAIWGIIGALKTIPHLDAQKPIERVAQRQDPAEAMQDMEHTDVVLHMIVLPNYDEDEAMMRETLQCFAEAEGAASFCVVLAMEEREGQEAFGKVARLRSQFASCFASLIGTFHPPNLEAQHMDGSTNPEVCGKGSNLKYAIQEAWDILEKDGRLSCQKSTILTVADVDCLFHPRYFNHVSREFNALREQPGDQHLWTIWQAPQACFRDYFSMPVCSRIWSYASTTYEYAGVSGLDAECGCHMVFSSFSLPLSLAIAAEAWDGDTICEDHHAYLKCLFYSCHVSATVALDSKLSMGMKCKPTLQVRPVYLPIKSTSVISPEGYFATWMARWSQAKRHAQGVAEFSFAILGVWDTLTSIPWHVQSFYMFYRLGQVLVRLWCMHFLPVSQAIGLSVLTWRWFANGRNLPMCPNAIWWGDLTIEDELICGLAGAWVLVWPVVIPMLFVCIANFLIMYVVFFRNQQSHQATSTWDRAGLAEPEQSFCCCVSARMGAFLLVMFDCFVCFSPLMVVYGFLVELLAYFNVAIWGNTLSVFDKASVKRSTPPPLRTKASMDYGTLKEPGSAEAGENEGEARPVFTGPGNASCSSAKFARPSRQEGNDPFLTGRR